MTKTNDPFAHHPALKAHIQDPETSFFRDFNVGDLLRKFPELEEIRHWAYSDAKREAPRDAILKAHEGPLWIFAYGSLMWDPALRFSEVRRARLEGFERQFILVDTKGGRGTQQSPGLMAALHHGNGCEGLAFCIEPADVDRETEILFRREMMGPGYHARIQPIQIEAMTVPALTFVADLTCADMQPGLPRTTQLRYIANGKGFLGTSYDYLANIVAQFAKLGIEDQDCSDMLQDVDALRAKTANEWAP